MAEFSARAVKASHADNNRNNDFLHARSMPGPEDENQILSRRCMVNCGGIEGARSAVDVLAHPARMHVEIDPVAAAVVRRPAAGW